MTIDATAQSIEAVAKNRTRRSVCFLAERLEGVCDVDINREKASRYLGMTVGDIAAVHLISHRRRDSRETVEGVAGTRLISAITDTGTARGSPETNADPDPR